MEEKTNEILEYISKLKKIANELYLHGCEPEELIIYRMNSCIQGIEDIIKK